VSHHRGTLGVSLGVGALLTFWSMLTGTKALLSALNVAYDESERRGLLRIQLTGLGITVAAFSAAVLALAVLVAIPQVLHFLGAPRPARGLLHTLSVLLLLVFVAGAIVMLYRFGPSRHPDRMRRVLPGAILTTLLWLAASSLFQLYVNHLANFDATYGPLGAMAGVMLWFWVTTYVMLLGAELNSALEHTPEDA
jgi:membrane protein